MAEIHFILKDEQEDGEMALNAECKVVNNEPENEKTVAKIVAATFSALLDHPQLCRMVLEAKQQFHTRAVSVDVDADVNGEPV